MSLLEIRNLHVSVQGKKILDGIDLNLEEGETLALLGPNGHGKSTLLSTIMGNPAFTVESGSINFKGQDLLKLSVDERSKAGLFLAMQIPPEIPGVNSADFLKAAMNARREKPMSLFEFYTALQNAYKEVGIPFQMSNRNLNEGFSGGEKKRSEILQMILLNPTLSMLDEIDSGLDVDAMQTVSECIRKQQEKGKSFLVVSHYARLYSLIHPTRAAVIVNGKVAVTGGPEVISRIDSEGYEWIKRELGIEIAKPVESMNKVSIGVCATRVAATKESK